MKILGLDPAIAECGWAVITMTGDKPAAVDAGVWRTKPSDKKLHRLATDDTIDRVSFLDEQIHETMKRHKIVVVIAEAFSAPRNASAAAKVAMVWGAVISNRRQLKTGLQTVSPQELKLAMCGVRSASKDDVASAVLARLGPSFEPMLEANGIPEGQWNHAYDAAAAALVCWDSPVSVMLRKAGVR